eukprot:CAMPEP_0170590074 /NCGR_PEP_ID=MMETSP0224-20130122/11676_1 /TAXON_ID=285029 /ORGANISM="Togula jolla, Strain CCCM 725" /LENGTH=70 /DNA_ID=CAMNT_0010913847 /DNA_START=369 /DNA_END=581 /DNA_ORIENTATION=+
MELALGAKIATCALQQELRHGRGTVEPKQLALPRERQRCETSLSTMPFHLGAILSARARVRATLSRGLGE